MADTTKLDEKSDAELKRETRARLKRLSPAATAELVNEAVSKKVVSPFTGFITFLRERAVVGLAIGFVIGTQVQAVVKQFITSFVDPLFALVIPGNKTLSDQTWAIHLGNRHAVFGWGAVAYALLDFIFILVIIYAVLKILQLDRLDKKI